MTTPSVDAPPAAGPEPPIDGSGTERARCVLAPNPSPMTLDGTNTWLIAEPGSADGDRHRSRARWTRATCSGSATRWPGAGQRVAVIVLTHRHRDHSAGAARLAELTGAPVRAVDPAPAAGRRGPGRRRRADPGRAASCG